MNNGILIIAHAPLASALRQCVLHVFPDQAEQVVALDVQPNTPAAETRAIAGQMMQALGTPGVLVLTDMFGATPCNVAQVLVDGAQVRLLAGVNVPMLLRAVTYANEPLESMAQRAMAGGTQGVMQVSFTAPLNQGKSSHDQDHHDDQQ
jgi:PTS system mannose-specific IIA component